MTLTLKTIIWLDRSCYLLCSHILKGFHFKLKCKSDEDPITCYWYRFNEPLLLQVAWGSISGTNLEWLRLYRNFIKHKGGGHCLKNRIKCPMSESITCHTYLVIAHVFGKSLIEVLDCYYTNCGCCSPNPGKVSRIS